MSVSNVDFFRNALFVRFGRDGAQCYVEVAAYDEGTPPRLPCHPQLLMAVLDGTPHHLDLGERILTMRLADDAVLLEYGPREAPHRRCEVRPEEFRDAMATVYGLGPDCGLAA